MRRGDAGLRDLGDPEGVSRRLYGRLGRSRARFDRDFGIFGFNVPVISEYETIPVLPEEAAIKGILDACPSVAKSAPMVSGAALLETGRGYQAKLAIFGVDGPDYFSLFPSLSFVSGEIPRSKAAWIVLPKTRVEEIEKAEGRKVELGEKLQLVMAVGDSFTIRAVSLEGIVEPEAENGEASLLAYTDPTTIRSLMGLSIGARKAKGAEEPADGRLEHRGSFRLSRSRDFRRRRGHGPRPRVQAPRREARGDSGRRSR